MCSVLNVKQWKDDVHTDRIEIGRPKPFFVGGNHVVLMNYSAINQPCFSLILSACLHSRFGESSPGIFHPFLISFRIRSMAVPILKVVFTFTGFNSIEKEKTFLMIWDIHNDCVKLDLIELSGFNWEGIRENAETRHCSTGSCADVAHDRSWSDREHGWNCVDLSRSHRISYNPPAYSDAVCLGCTRTHCARLLLDFVSDRYSFRNSEGFYFHLCLVKLFRDCFSYWTKRGKYGAVGSRSVFGGCLVSNLPPRLEILSNHSTGNAVDMDISGNGTSYYSGLRHGTWRPDRIGSGSHLSKGALILCGPVIIPRSVHSGLCSASPHSSLNSGEEKWPANTVHL